MLLLPGLRSRALAEAVHWSTRRARAEVVNSPKIGSKQGCMTAPAVRTELFRLLGRESLCVSIVHVALLVGGSIQDSRATVRGRSEIQHTETSSVVGVGDRVAQRK